MSLINLQKPENKRNGQRLKTESLVSSYLPAHLERSGSLGGGQHSFAHQADIENSLFTHEDEAQDPLLWLFWLFQTGTVSAVIGIGSFCLRVKLFNARVRAKAANEAN